MGVVEISSGNHITMSDLLHGVESLGVSAFLHEPSRRLWAEENQDSEGYGGDECGSKLESPCDRSDIFDNGIGTELQYIPGRTKEMNSRETQEDTESGP